MRRDARCGGRGRTVSIGRGARSRRLSILVRTPGEADLHGDRTGVQRRVRARGGVGGRQLDAVGESDFGVDAILGVVIVCLVLVGGSSGDVV